MIGLMVAVAAAVVGLLLAWPRAPDDRQPAPVRRVRARELPPAWRGADAEDQDEFLAVLSHELRTPLNAIIGWTRVLATTSDPGTVARAVAALQRNALAQIQIIDDLLDLSQLTTGKVRLEVSVVNLVPIVESALDVVRPAAVAKRIGMVADLDPADGVVMGDPVRLRQVVWNLLANAVKFTPPGGSVAVRLHRDGAVAVSVADTGQGIAPAMMPHLFERFRQAERGTTRRHGGLGIGLALVRHLVELHGGTVEAESGGAGHGAQFTVRLPLPPAAAPARPSFRARAA